MNSRNDRAAMKGITHYKEEESDDEYLRIRYIVVESRKINSIIYVVYLYFNKHEEFIQQAVDNVVPCMGWTSQKLCCSVLYRVVNFFDLGW